MDTKILLILVLSFFSFLSNAQTQYPDFPIDQHSYLGAYPEFFKDFHNILIEKNLKPCENKKEFTFVPILIKSENSAEVIEMDSLKSEKHKCSIELTAKVVKYLDKWMPAKIDGKETPAIKRIPIYPDDLFEKYKEGYNFLEVDYEKSDFDVEELRKKVVKKINLDNFGYRGKGKLTVICSFAINYKGRLDNIKIEQSSGSQKFDEMIIDAIKQTQKNKQWKPAKTHEFAINSYFKFPITINIQ